MDETHIDSKRKLEAQLSCFFVGLIQGEINKAIATQNDMTLTELAKMSGLSFSQLLRLLESPRKAKLNQLIRVMAALEIDVEVFNRIRSELSGNIVLLTDKIQEAVKARNPNGWTFPYAEVYKILEKGYQNDK